MKTKINQHENSIDIDLEDDKEQLEATIHFQKHDGYVRITINNYLNGINKVNVVPYGNKNERIIKTNKAITIDLAGCE